MIEAPNTRCHGNELPACRRQPGSNQIGLTPNSTAPKNRSQIQWKTRDQNSTRLANERVHCNAIWDLAPHDISIMNCLLDWVPSTVAVWASLNAAETEDVAFIRLEYQECGRMPLSSLYRIRSRCAHRAKARAEYRSSRRRRSSGGRTLATFFFNFATSIAARARTT
jgi:hypothetical protein